MERNPLDWSPEEAQNTLALARAHTLALAKIPGIRVAVVKARFDGDLLDTELYCCVGHCTKCDSFWRVFRASPSLILEVVEVGYSESPAPA